MSKLFNLYWPGMKPGFIISALFPFIAYLLAAISEKYVGYSLEWLVNFPVMFLLCTSPLMLTKRDNRAACQKLHVGASGKLSFLLISFWVLIPAIIFISLYVAQLLSSALFGICPSINLPFIANGANGLSSGLNEFICIYLGVISIVTVTMFYVVKAKKNRTLAGLLSCIILICLIPVFGGIAAVVIYILAYLKIAQIDTVVSYQSYGLWTMYGVVAILAIIGLIYLIMLYKRLRHSGF